jgi:hypothetical protein
VQRTVTNLRKRLDELGLADDLMIDGTNSGYYMLRRPPPRFDLRLMSALNRVSRIPTEGKNLVVVAAVDEVLHFRIFDDDGEMVVDTDEKRLTVRVRRIASLRNQLSSLWPPHELTGSEKGRVITAVTSIVGHTPPPRP